MAINKVEFGNQTLIDLTGDTATPEDVLGGKTFHTKSGEASVGTAGPYAGSNTNGGSATTAKKLFGQDTRSVNSPPSFYLASGQNSTLVTEFKNRAVIDAPGSSSFGTLITVTPWMDSSGGLPVQTYVDNTGQKAIRFAQTSETWGSWSTLASNSDIPSVGNGTIKLQRNGVDVLSFTTNQSGNVTGNLIIPTKVSELTNDSEFISDDDPRLTDSRNAKDVYAWAKASTKPSYTASEVGLGNVPNVTTDNQTPTVTEASTRANIATGDTLKTIIGKIKKFFTDLKTVAFTGSYNDLTNKPTIPAAQVNSDWNATSGVAQILNKPTIPTVNNATLTIQKNGTNVQTFTANQSTNATANITVPTKVSELTNDSGYVTTDTKNTAGSTDTSSKIFLVGATSQAANPQTYSHDTAYVGTDGCLYSGGTKVLTAHQSLDPIKHTNTDIPEGASNLNATATAHKITAYRNGFTIPYQMDNVNDGGMLRVRGTSENNCILELGTWDDSGAGETIQFNYYPSTSQVTPTYSVSVPKKSGTIALTSDIPGVVSTTANGLAPKVTDTSKFLKGDGTWATPTDTNNAVTQTATSTSADYEVLFSATADNTTRTEGARKNSNLKFNPSTGNLTVTKVNGEVVKYTSSVNAVVGDTTCTISDSSIATTSLIEPFSSNSTGDTIAIKNIAVTAGQAVLTFKALTVDTSFRLRITNV